MKTNTATSTQRWVDEIEKHVLAQQQIMAKAAADCVKYKELISEAYSAAKNQGISVKALKALILERKHLANAAKVRDKLEDEDLVAELEMLRDSVKAVAGIDDLFAFAADQIEGEIDEAKGRRRKGGAAEKNAAAKSEALDDLSKDPFDGPDPRPPHLQDAHEQAEAEAAEAAARNAAALEGGIKQIET